MIRKGDKGAEVKTCQLLLKKWGFNIAADGDFGDNTQAAVIKFQEKNKLEVDGIIGDVTNKYLQYITQLLRIGDQGDSVYALQQLLAGDGYAIAVDNIFGDGTLNAVKDLQYKHQLHVDGLVGQNTWEAFFLKNSENNSADHKIIQAEHPDNKETVSKLIADISHHNGDVDLQKAYQDELRAIFHKATQGSGYKDNKYETNLEKAKEANLLWGAYHFGDGSDVTAQAKHFLSVIGKTGEVVPVLDFEENPLGATMTFDQAKEFVKIIYSETGIYPGLYGGSLIKESLKQSDPGILSKCWLWIAQYSSKPTIPSAWNEWVIWQYTDGQNGPAPHAANGIGNCDRDIFNGDMELLVKFWKQNSI